MRVLSGVQSYGKLHLGNYLGAVRNWVNLQQDHDCYFFLANLHSLTTKIAPEELKRNTFDNACLYLACGIDPSKSTIFIQSDIAAHSEACWIFSCITPMGWLSRMTQFKDKSTIDVNLGLFIYPVLMAADILLYQPDFVPVGEDQKQHVEFVRDIAGVINRKKNIFKLPNCLFPDKNLRVKSLQDGRKKMSKSDPSLDSCIFLLDSEKNIENKIKKAKTDSIQEIYYDSVSRPEISNLLEIFATFTGDEISKISSQYSSFSVFKKDLAEVLIQNIKKIQDKYFDLRNNEQYVLDLLKVGTEKASYEANKNLLLLKEVFGV